MRLLTYYALYILICHCNLHVALGTALEDSAAEREAFDQELARVRSTSKSLSSQGPNNLADYERFARDVQDRWKGRQPEDYGRLVLEMCKPLGSRRFSEGRRNDLREYNLRQHNLVREVALSALEKPDAISLALELQLTGYVSVLSTLREGGDDQQFSRERRKDAEVRLHAWGRLVKAIDPNWDPNDVPRINIAPPAATGLPGGVAPDAIEDPALRAEYEADIKKNREKNERFGVQYELRQWLKEYPWLFEHHLIEAYSMPPQRVDELSGLLKQFMPDEQIRTRMLDAVRKNWKGKPSSDGPSPESTSSDSAGR